MTAAWPVQGSPVKNETPVQPRTEPFHQTPHADVRAVARIPRGLEVLAIIATLPWADRGGWRGSIRQLAEKLLELTGHQWNRDRLTVILRALVAAGALVMERAGRWWTTFRVRRPGVSTLDRRAGVKPPPAPPLETAEKAPASRQDARKTPGRGRAMGQGLASLWGIVGAITGARPQPIAEGGTMSKDRQDQESRRRLLEQTRRLAGEAQARVRGAPPPGPGDLDTAEGVERRRLELLAQARRLAEKEGAPRQLPPTEPSSRT